MRKIVILLVSTLLFFHFEVRGQWKGFLVNDILTINTKSDNYTLLKHLGGPVTNVEKELYLMADSILANHKKSGFSVLAKHSRFQDFCERNNIHLLGGPMLGDISDSTVTVWTRTTKPSAVKIALKINGKGKFFGPVKSTLKSDLTSSIFISGLKPGSSYEYNVYVNDIKIELPFETSFQTTDVNKKITRIAFGSCFHRGGLGNQNLSKAILERNPDALLLLGDIAVQDRENDIGQHSLDYLARDFYPAWTNLVSKIPVYTIWDDHDYFNNDLYNIPEGYTLEDKEAVSDIWRSSWNNPSYGSGEEGKGVYFRTRIGPVDVIMLDNRYFREKGNFLGDEQMQWLEKQLLECKEPFIILSSGTMWSDYVSDGKDSWGEFDPESREKIFKVIERSNIKGVLLISGDRHGARIFTIPRSENFKFYEFEVASLGGISGPPVSNPEWSTNLLYGMSGQYAFGEFSFDMALPNPAVNFRLINEQGTVLYEITLTRSQLTP